LAKTRITLEEAQQEFIKRGYIPLFEIFNGAHEKLVAQTEEGYKVQAILSKLKRGDKPSKFGNNNPYTIDNIKLWLELNDKPFELVSNEYKEAHENLQWKCLKENCGEISEASWNNFSNGYDCPYCRKDRATIIREDTNVSVIKDSKLILVNKEFLEQYVNNGYSIYKMSEILNISKTSLGRILKQYGLKTNPAIESQSYIYDKTGMKYGKLYVVKYEYTGEDGYKYYLCKCECGNEKIISSGHLNYDTKSCGCLVGGWHWKDKVKNEKALSHIGEIINGVEIIDILHVKTDKYKMICKCICGNIFNTSYWGLKHGRTRSCGCYAKEISSIIGSTYGANFYKHKYKWFFIKDNQKIKCRSGFEVLYANWLIDNNIDFTYEDKCFKLDNGKRYTPDFYLINENRYIEIKGSFKMNDNRQFDNIQLFKEKNILDILYWKDIYNVCGLRFKYYNDYLNKAKKLNIPYEEYLGNREYLKEVI
jgi:hypothetical protein